MSKNKETESTKVERTGQNTFNVQHDDGSIFECKLDPNKVRFKKDGLGDAGGGTRFYLPDNPKIGNVMSNADRRRMGVEQDPALPDYQTQ